MSDGADVANKIFKAHDDNITFTHVANGESDLDEYIEVTNDDSHVLHHEVKDTSFHYSNNDQGHIPEQLESNRSASHQTHGGTSRNSSNSSDSYFQSCIDQLCDREVVTSLVQHLSHHGMLQHYMHLFKFLASGELSPLEIPVLLCLERALFLSLCSTTQMNYHHVLV